MNKISSVTIRHYLFLSINMIVGAFVAHTTAYAVGGVMSGSGTVADPYLVEDYADLKAVGTTYGLGAVYRMTADIDASASATENGGSGFTPIGRSVPFFTGTLHGSGHVIRNLTINRPDSSFAGLFSYTKGLVDSLGLEDLYLRAWSYVGGIAGENDGTINQCYVTGTVIGNGGTAGGLAGRNNGYSTAGTIDRCYAYCQVSGGNGTGGLVGSNYYGKVYDSYATGPVSGTGSVGGLAGSNSSSTLTKCYATGPVTGSENNVGGLVGSNYFYYAGSIIKCYATGSVTSSGQYIGGLVGYNYGWSIGTVSDCYSSGKVAGGGTVGGIIGYHKTTTVSGSYWDIDASGQTTGIGSNSGTGVPTGLTTAAMRQSASFSGWDFPGVWNIRADSTYPGLQALDNAPFAFNDTLTSDRSFPLSNLLSNDFDVETAGSALVLKVTSTSAGTTDSTTTLTFSGGIPNGTVAAVKYRVGEVRASDTLWGNIASAQLTLVTLDGSGTEGDPFLIANYTDLKTVGINSTYHLGAVYRMTADIDASPSASENGGEGFIPIGNGSSKFTGKFHGAGHLISNLYINRPTTDYVGLFGYASGATIDSLGLAGGVVSGYGTVGSLSGYLISSGAVSDCHSNCQVTGGYYHVGGLIGLVDQSAVSRCYSTGMVSDTLSFVGGLIGSIDNYGSVTESFATGTVYGGGCVGGLVGYNIRYSTVNKCYATGPVTLVRSSAVGGLVGYNKTSATISQSYSTGFVTGSAYAGGLVGGNSASTVNSSYWGIESSGKSSGLGYSDLGATFSATGLAITAMKQSASFSVWDFSGVWNIRADSTYPGLKALDNAPFAFQDTLRSDTTFMLAQLLLNDCDLETAQAGLVLQVISVSAGITDSASNLSLPGNTVSGLVDTVVYRVGEVRLSDTLWGNQATALVTIDNAPPAAPALAWPTNGAISGDSAVTFRWSPAADDFGLGHYRLQCAADSGFTAALQDTAVADTGLVLTVSLADSLHYWRVRAVDACGNVGEYSSVWRFEIDVTSPIDPSLLTPANNAWLSSDTAFCTWSAVSKKTKASAVYYVLKAYALSDTINPVVVDTTSLTSDTLLVSQGRYRWLVEAYDEAGNPPGISGFFNFGYDTTSPAMALLISPNDSLITNQSNNNFIWNSCFDSISGLKNYTLQYAYDAGFTEGLAETTLTDTSIALILADSNYCWRVVARDTVGNTSISGLRYLTVDTHDPNVPTLLSPIDDCWTIDTTLVCSWTEVAKKASPAAKASEVSYVIQLDTNNTFASPIIEDTTNILLDSFNLSEGQYYWRVMAFDLAGNFGIYSAYRTFGIDTTAPDIQYVTNLPDDPSSPYGPYEVSSKVYDLSGVKTAYMFTRINGGGWDSTAMFSVSDSLRDSIPEINPATDETLSVSYYLKISDMLDHQSTSSTYSFKAIGPSGVAGKPGTSLPTVYALQNAYPNPSRGQTIFKYQLPKESKASLTVYNVVGQAIKRFDQGTKPAGYHQISWNDNTLPNGIYFYRLQARLCQGSGGQAGEFSSTKKLLIVR